MALLKLTEKSIAASGRPSTKLRRTTGTSNCRGTGSSSASGHRAFLVRGRSNRKQVKVTIGDVGGPRVERGTWTAAAARDEAKVILGRMAGGHNPNAEKRAAVAASSATLREALEYHLSKMKRGENRRRKPCSPRSITTVRSSVETRLTTYLGRPIVDLTSDVLAEVMANLELNYAAGERDHRRGLCVPTGGGMARITGHDAPPTRGRVEQCRP